MVRLSLSLPALERLIGGDNPLEVELRHQIVNAFAEKHLKCLVSHDLVYAAEQKVRKEVEGMINAAIKQIGNPETSASWAREATFRLNENVRKAIDAAVEDKLSKMIHEAIEVRMESSVRTATREVSRAVDRYLGEKKIEELINQGIKERLEAAASLVREGRQPRSIIVGEVP